MSGRRRAVARVSRLAPAPVVRRPAPVVAARPIGPVIPVELADDFLNGRLSQRCPEPGCETVEAAGFSSTCHELPTGPADWFRGGWSEARKAAGQARIQFRASEAATARKSAPPAPLASDTGA